MDAKVLAAVVDAIKGELSKDSPLSIREFEAIHNAVAISERKWAIELVSKAREDFKRQVEELAARIL